MQQNVQMSDIRVSKWLVVKVERGKSIKYFIYQAVAMLHGGITIFFVKKVTNKGLHFQKRRIFTYILLNIYKKS